MSHPFGPCYVARIALATCLILIVSVIGHAKCVRFDVTDLVACQNVTTDEFRTRFPDEKLLRASFDVSTYVTLRAESDITQVTHIIEFPERTGRIVEYAPKTNLETRVAGEINVNRQDEKNSSIGVNANTKLDTWISLNANASKGKRNSESVQYKRLPEKNWTAASGTLSRGTAVYFKIRPSLAQSIEGARNFSIVFRVPKTWRADYLHIRSAAYLKSAARSSSNDKPLCGINSFHVGIYEQGDIPARKKAGELLVAIEQLTSMADQYRLQIHQPPEANEFRRFVNSIRGKKEQNCVPTNWLSQIHSQPTASRTKTFEQHLPEPVREAILTYRAAKSQLKQISKL